MCGMEIKHTGTKKTGRYDSFYVECFNCIEMNIEFYSIRLLMICLLSAYIRRMRTRWLAKTARSKNNGGFRFFYFHFNLFINIIIR